MKVKIFFIIALCLVGVSAVIHQSQAAILTIDSDATTTRAGTTFLVDVILNSEKEVINAVEAVITYPADLLEVIEVSRGGSFLTLWPEEPEIDEILGTVSLTGGIPNGSMVFDGKVVTITFLSKKAGGAEVDFYTDDTSVRLNDGQGTKAELSFSSGLFPIVPNSYITIFSKTHPEEHVWYSNDNLEIEWSTQSGAEYSYHLTDSIRKEPDNEKEPLRGRVTFPGLSNRIHYFVLKEKLPDQNWQVIGIRRAMVDVKPPLPISLEIGQEPSLYDGKYFLVFSATDEHSGISHFDVTEGEETYKGVSSPYIVKDQSMERVVVVTAYDNAGNSTRYVIGEEDETTERATVNGIFYLVIGIILTLLVILFVLARRKRKN
ncbi:cohesin domain-containing protein [Patescibacteria group bacterium]